MKLIAYISLLISFTTAFAQEKARLYGHVSDENGDPVEAVNIAIVGRPGGAVSDEKGHYSLRVPAGKKVTVAYTHINFKPVRKEFAFEPGEEKEYLLQLSPTAYELGTFDIKEEQMRTQTMERIDPKVIEVIPSASGSFETVLKTLPGVSSSNELSAQYSVRGGNFDENLVYVNDIQVYRPFLIRSGRQEGLSFVNSNLVSSVSFSAGGFEAKYGDKLSSVLDIQYKEPKDFAGSVSTSLQGASAHAEGSSDNHRFTYLTGIRYKTNRYVLSSLDTDGDYRPSFGDVQTYLTYDISETWEIGFLGNVSMNQYKFVPQNRQTDWGTVNQALRLSVFFDGSEVDKFETYFGAISNTFKIDRKKELKVITSAFRSLEDETYDIRGQYSIDELERDLSDKDFGDVAFNRGVGTYHNHARNYLDATVANLAVKGKILQEKGVLLAGVKVQHEIINDELSEWDMIDSAGFSLPHPNDNVGYNTPDQRPEQEIVLDEVVKSDIRLRSTRFTGYLQKSWEWETADTNLYTFTAGLRSHYWDLNRQTVVSPRINISLVPNWERDYLFRLSGGLYHQPPFYRELRDRDGNVHTDVKAQESVHAVFGTDYNFKAWGRPFKFVAELYYKYLWNVNPYEVENVRIRYYAENNAKAYATGIDLKVNGEFVKGVQSWASLSVMQTKESIEDDYYYDYYNSEGEKIIEGFTFNNVPVDSEKVEPGYIPRPTDQLVNFGLFFQDYLPRNPTYKMHLTLYYATGLPFSPPDDERYRNQLRIPPYRRVDIGFSKLLLGEGSELKPNNPFRHFKSIWLGLEVFNLLQINNTISYLWVKDVTNRQYAVPNYLTSRQLNVKLNMKF